MKVGKIRETGIVGVMFALMLAFGIVVGISLTSLANAAITWPSATPAGAYTGGTISVLLKKILIDDNFVTLNGSGELRNFGIVEKAVGLYRNKDDSRDVRLLFPHLDNSLIDAPRHRGGIGFGSGSSSNPSAYYGLLGDLNFSTGSNIFEMRAEGGTGYTYDARISSYGVDRAKGTYLNISGEEKKITISGWGRATDSRLSNGQATLSLDGLLDVSNTICLRGACITQWPNPLTATTKFTPVTKYVNSSGQLVLPSSLQTEAQNAMRFFPQDGSNIANLFYQSTDTPEDGIRIPITQQLIDAVGYSGAYTNWFTVGIDLNRRAYDGGTAMKMITLTAGSSTVGNHAGVKIEGNPATTGLNNALVYTGAESSFIYCGYLIEDYDAAGARIGLPRQMTTKDIQKCNSIRLYDQDRALVWSGMTTTDMPSLASMTLEYPIRRYQCDPAEPDQVADIMVEFAIVPLINRENTTSSQSQAQSDASLSSSCDYASGYASTLLMGDNEIPNLTENRQGRPVSQTISSSCASNTAGRQLIARLKIVPKTQAALGDCQMPASIRDFVASHTSGGPRQFTRVSTPAPNSLNEDDWHPARIYIDNMGVYTIK